MVRYFSGKMLDDSDESHVIRAMLDIESHPHVPAPDPREPGHDGVEVDHGEIVTLDTLVEGVHFDERLDPSDVGWKTVAVNASDIGAMGGRPTWALLSLALPSPLDRSWIQAFATGLREAMARWSIRLVGGDTVRSPGPVVVSLTLAGQARGPAPGRGRAQAGDGIWVTGALGRASAGFFGLGDPSWLRRPFPPVEFGGAIVESRLVHAMMDLSDGLATDLPRLCRASGVGAEIAPDRLPLAESLVGRPDALDHAVAFGDDYELLVVAPPSAEPALRAHAVAHEVSLTSIGRVTDSGGARLRGRAWPTPRFTHFQGAGS